MKEMLDICSFNKGCIEVLDTITDNLSEGEKQRVFLSIFLSLSNKVLLLDEVTSALDYSTAYKVFSNLKNFAKKNNLTVLSICHDKSLINNYGDSCITFGE